jgi:hypothetical protein
MRQPRVNNPSVLIVQSLQHDESGEGALAQGVLSASDRAQNVNPMNSTASVNWKSGTAMIQSTRGLRDREIAEQRDLHHLQAKGEDDCRAEHAGYDRCRQRCHQDALGREGAEQRDVEDG